MGSHFPGTHGTHVNGATETKNMQSMTYPYAVAPLAWVPWVPGNPSVFEQWVPEPITFETKK